MISLRKAQIAIALAFFFLLGLSPVARARSKTQISQPPSDAQLVTLKGNVHPLAQAKYDQGAAPDALPLNKMLLVLKRDAATQKALDTFVAQQSDPKSNNYHKWLTPQQFRESYGVATNDLQVVTSWLSSHGFTQITLNNANTIIEFSGTAGQVRSAFHTTMHQYAVAGVTHWANANDPQIPVALAPAIQGIVSLNNFGRKALHQNLGLFSYSKETRTWTQQSTSNGAAKVLPRKSPKTELTTTTSSGSTYYAVGPGDFATIYNVKPLWDAGIDGTGQQIAIVGRAAIATGDVDQFRSAFGLPATKLNIIPVGDMPTETTDADEAQLDIEWAGGVAKNATIDYVVAASTNTTDGVDLAIEYAVDNAVAPVMSVSYGFCELGLGTSGNAYFNEIWEQAVSEGITVMVATGDGSAATCDQGYSIAEYGLQVNGIASTPYTVAVGGTDFNDFDGTNGVSHSAYWSSTNDPTTLSSALTYIPEMVWNDSCANNQLVSYFGFTDSESLCNSDVAYTDGLINIAGAGGGVSSCTVSDGSNASSCSGGYTKPAWQNVAGVPDDNLRDIPDVSLFAADGITGSFLLYCLSSNTPNGVCDYSDSDNLVYMGGGGTSFASPAFAGIMALVDQQAKTPQGNANFVLYSLARTEFGTQNSPNTSNLSQCSSDLGNGVANSCVFNDVDTGDNAVPCYNGTTNCTILYPSDQYGVTSGYYATTGYDVASGLGSINAYNLVNNWAQAAQLSPTTTQLDVTPTSGTYGNMLNYTITVTPQSGSGSPSGTALLLADNSLVATVTLANGVGKGTVAGVGAGSHTLLARYVSDGVFNSSASNTVKVSLAQAGTSASLALYEVNPLTGASTASGTVHYGSNVLAKSTVTGISGLAVPTGTLNFVSTGTDSQSVALDSTGAASATLAQLNVGGSETISAGYLGDGNYLASKSGSLGFNVVQAITTVRIASSTSYQVGAGNINISTTAYAYSSGNPPTGILDLYLNGAKYTSVTGTSGTDSLTGGAAITAQFTVPTTALKTGANTFSVSYEGDVNYASANSTTLTVGYGLTLPSSTVTLTSSVPAATTQESVALTAAVKLPEMAAGAGSVVFYDNGLRIAEIPVVRNSANSSLHGTATLYKMFAEGSHSFTATFSGYGAVPAATSTSALSLTVTGTQASLTTITATANAQHSSNYDFSASVIGFGIAAPTGTVTFDETSTVATLASATIDPTLAAFDYSTYQNMFSSNGSGVEYLATGDLNNDGIQDLVTRRLGGNGTDYLDVYLGTGGGNYAPVVEYPVGESSRGHQIIIADLNGDGFMDVATANQINGTISLLLGNGDGTLQPASSVTVQRSPVTLAVGDFNHDGILDLMTTSIAAGNASVVLGNGDGTFQSPIASSLSGFPEYPAVGDVNGDGNADIVYMSLFDYPSVLHVALGNGDGTFTDQSTTYDLTSDAYINQIRLADVNKDGYLDAICANFYSGTVIVANGGAQGVFSNPVEYNAGFNQPWISDAIPVDINGDGNVDIAALDTINSAVGILFNNGDGTFQAVAATFPTIELASELYTADMNGDGIPDLLQTSQSNSDSEAVILFGGRKVSVKSYNVVTYGAYGDLEQGLAIYNGDSTTATSTSSDTTFYASGIKATPQLVWNPVSTTWTAGIPLGGILDATTVGNVNGTYTYTAQLSGGGSSTTVNGSSMLVNLGTYVISVLFTPADTSSYNPATAQISISLVNPDFTLNFTSANDNGLTLSAGGTGSGTVAVGGLYGFYGYVNLSCTTSAPGINCALGQSAIAAGATTTATITVAGASSTARNEGIHLKRVGYTAGAIAAALLIFFIPSRRSRKFLASILLMIAIGTVIGCGSGPRVDGITLETLSAKAASGSSVKLIANLLPLGTQVESGVVSFYDGSTLLGTANVTKGSATFTTSSLGVGIHSIKAQYAKNAEYVPYTSTAVQVEVTGQTTVTVTGSFGSATHSSTLNITLQ